MYIISSSNLFLDPPVYLSIVICPSPSNRAPNRLQEVREGLGPQLWGKSPDDGIVPYVFSPNVDCVEFLTSSHFPGYPTMGCISVIISTYRDMFFVYIYIYACIHIHNTYIYIYRTKPQGHPRHIAIESQPRSRSPCILQRSRRLSDRSG